ncbi:MAG: MMPL family transporter [Deltaproteobacteria bacterium]|nr:MMPL family transporter [Deltaproteobacteria bacterium]
MTTRPVSRRERFFNRLAGFQYHRPLVVVLIAFALAGSAVPLVLRLGIKTGFAALLPREKPSVKDLEAAGDRIGGLTTLTVAVQSEDREAMQRFAKALVSRLQGMKISTVRSVEWNIASYEDFVYAHRHLYAELQDLKQIRAQLEERLEFERARANPLYVDLLDEPPPEPEELIERMRQKGDKAREKLKKYPGGFYIHPERGFLAIFLRTDIEEGDALRAEKLIASVSREVTRLGPKEYASDLRVEYGGDLLSVREEHSAIKNELLLATSITILLVLASIYLFFLRFRSIPLLGLALAVPVILTFGFAELTVDYLNTSTAFLGSIVIGNGVNPNIIWLARYFEQRRRGSRVAEALAASHHGTWAATLVASLAAGIAYASLVLTDFRGFRDFGIIGGVGMLLCWVSALGLLPALTVLSERLRPMKFGPTSRYSGLYSRVFFRLLVKAPGSILVLSLLLCVAGLGLIAYAIYLDPIEYDFRNLRSEERIVSRSRVINRYAGEIVGRSGSGNTIVVMLPERNQTASVEAQLEQRRDLQKAPIGPVRSIDDLLPKEQAEKIPVLADIRKLLLEMRPYANDKQRKLIDEHIPAEKIERLKDKDLPEDIARRFTERDGTRGRILFVEPEKDKSTWDGRYLVQWTKALRQIRLDDGTRPPLAGRAPVFADMIEVVWTDGPKAIVLALSATTLLLIFSFPTAFQRLLTLGALLLGIVWMAGTMALLGVKLNFLNFVAFPITFGNGADYGVNVMRRYCSELGSAGSAQAVRSAVLESGGAVVLCSLTTIIGYSSLYVSANRALNSFGLAMAISEVTCLAAAVLVMPALLLLLSKRAREGTDLKNERRDSIQSIGKSRT